jgi:F-type H+-transporting ATPase subunit epsilon
MAGLVQLQLVTLSGVKFDEEVYEVLLPTLDGQIGVMPGHMPLVSVAIPGLITIRRKPTDRDDYMEDFAISGGVIEVRDNVLRVLVDEADHSEEINEAEAQKAFDEAKRLRETAKSRLELERAQELMDRQSVRLQVAGLQRRRNRRP